MGAFASHVDPSVNRGPLQPRENLSRPLVKLVSVFQDFEYTCRSTSIHADAERKGEWSGRHLRLGLGGVNQESEELQYMLVLMCALGGKFSIWYSAIVRIGKAAGPPVALSQVAAVGANTKMSTNPF